MPKITRIIIQTIVLLAALGVVYFIVSDKPADKNDTISDVTNPAPQASTTQTVSDGTISFVVPTDFVLAVSQAQVLVKKYIPPCDEGFDYCIYYYSDFYKNTNFESAGLSIRRRADLKTSETCLRTLPAGYLTIGSTTAEFPQYSIGKFGPLDDAAAGHYATGEEYRLFTDQKCYQFVLRLGQSRFENYPVGTIQEFTIADSTRMLSRIRDIVSGINLVKAESNLHLP